MRSLLSVIKQNRVSETDEVVLIPDVEFPDPVMVEEAGDHQDSETAPQIPPEVLHAQIVSKAQKEAKRVSEEIMRLARSEHDVLLEQANEEAESIRNRAYREGLEKGRMEKQAEIEKVIEETNHAIEQIKLDSIQYMQMYAEELKNLAVDIASRILAKQVNPDGHELGELVKTAVNSVKDADWITVEISDRMPGLLSYLESELKENRDNVEIAAKDLPEDACIIKTSDGNIDASVSTQLRNVREYFNQIE